jgi:hypothetical protein
VSETGAISQAAELMSITCWNLGKNGGKSIQPLSNLGRRTETHCRNILNIQRSFDALFIPQTLLKAFIDKFVNTKKAKTRSLVKTLCLNQFTVIAKKFWRNGINPCTIGR